MWTAGPSPLGSACWPHFSPNCLLLHLLRGRPGPGAHGVCGACIPRVSKAPGPQQYKACVCVGGVAGHVLEWVPPRVCVARDGVPMAVPRIEVSQHQCHTGEPCVCVRVPGCLYPSELSQVCCTAPSREEGSRVARSRPSPLHDVLRSPHLRALSVRVFATPFDFSRPSCPSEVFWPQCSFSPFQSRSLGFWWALGVTRILSLFP